MAATGSSDPAAAAAAAPRVSVVVPTYRRPELLMRCLGALVAQTLPRSAYEVIVVDDGHDEGTRVQVEALAATPGAPAIAYMRPQRPPDPFAQRPARMGGLAGERGPSALNTFGPAGLFGAMDDPFGLRRGPQGLKGARDGTRPAGPAGTHGQGPTAGRRGRAAGQGPAVARNVGWQAARGTIVAFTDDDTLPEPDWLEQGEAAMARGDWAALGGRVRVPRPADGARPTDHERMTQGLETAEFVTANAFVRRTALMRVLGFDERFTRAWREDSDLQFRLAAEAGPVGRCETAVVWHPARHERFGLSLRQQRNAFFEALLYAKHPRLYRERIGLPVPWHFYAIVALTLAALVLEWAYGNFGSALVAAALATGLVLRFAFQRLRSTSLTPEHVVEMLVTSALIPFLSVYWRLRGAWHFRVWFL